jgi:hypothetical protein
MLLSSVPRPRRARWRGPMWALALALAAVVPATGAAAAPPTASAARQGRYLYLWNHDANFKASQCAYLPTDLQASCQVAVHAQLADPRTVHESMAQRLRYLTLFQQGNGFVAGACAMLPARFVAPCLVRFTPRAPAAAALECTGVSGTVCATGGTPAGASTSELAAAAAGSATGASPPAAQAADGSGAVAPKAVQQRYLYYWTHDANFKADQCRLLPPSLWSACQIAVRVQLQKSPVAKESMAARAHYAQLFEQGARFTPAECAYLPAQYVASCVAQPDAGAARFALHCTGASGTICRLGNALPPGDPPPGGSAPETVAMVLGQPSAVTGGSSGLYLGKVLRFPANPTEGLVPVQCPLHGGGPTLVFSDGPEQVPGPGILYQDTLTGAVRVYLYHVNASSQPLYIGALLTDTGSAPVTIDLTASGEAGPSTNFVAVGKEAEHQWFEPMAPREFTLLPGRSRFLGQLAQEAVQPGQAVNGIYDFIASGGAVEVSVVAQSHAVPSTAGLRVLPSPQLNAAGTPMRGTFVGANLTCTTSAPLTLPQDGRLMFSFGQGGDTGSFLVGQSAVDGGARVVDYGNYGVLYHVDLSVDNSPSSMYDTYALLLHPRGNPFAGASITTGGVGTAGLVPLPQNQPFVENPDDALLLGTYELTPSVPTTVDVRWMSAAATALPIDLLLYPYN